MGRGSLRREQREADLRGVDLLVIVARCQRSPVAVPEHRGRGKIRGEAWRRRGRQSWAELRKVIVNRRESCVERSGVVTS